MEGAVDVIYRTLKLCGMHHDEGPDIGGPYAPYVQSERMGMFKSYAEQLVKAGQAYYCFCTPERLDEMRLVQKASGQAPHYDGHCRNLSQAEIDGYIASGEWQGKAGGYAVQGRAAGFIAHISGSYSGIMGLPLFETAQLLRSAGVQ